MKAASRPRFRFALPLLLLVSMAAAFSANADSAKAPAPAPTFTLEGRSGPVALDSLRGRVVYVDFWASWCDPCRRSFPWLQSLQAKYDSLGLTVVGVNVDKDHSLSEAFLRDHPVSFRIAYDAKGKVAEAYHVKVMPSSALIARDGTLVFLHPGFDPKQAADIEKRIQEALAR